MKKLVATSKYALAKACSEVISCYVWQVPYLKAETLSCGGLGPSGASPLLGKTLRQLNQGAEDNLRAQKKVFVYCLWFEMRMHFHNAPYHTKQKLSCLLPSQNFQNSTAVCGVKLHSYGAATDFALSLTDCQTFVYIWNPLTREEEAANPTTSPLPLLASCSGLVKTSDHWEMCKKRDFVPSTTSLFCVCIRTFEGISETTTSPLQVNFLSHFALLFLWLVLSKSLQRWISLSFA